MPGKSWTKYLRLPRDYENFTSNCDRDVVSKRTGSRASTHFIAACDVYEGLGTAQRACSTHIPAIRRCHQERIAACRNLNGLSN
jgi:hypothetical protein